MPLEHIGKISVHVAVQVLFEELIGKARQISSLVVSTGRVD